MLFWKKYLIVFFILGMLGLFWGAGYWFFPIKQFPVISVCMPFLLDKNLTSFSYIQKDIDSLCDVSLVKRKESKERIIYDIIYKHKEGVTRNEFTPIMIFILENEDKIISTSILQEKQRNLIQIEKGKKHSICIGCFMWKSLEKTLKYENEDLMFYLKKIELDEGK